MLGTSEPFAGEYRLGPVRKAVVSVILAIEATPRTGALSRTLRVTEAPTIASKGQGISVAPGVGPPKPQTAAPPRACHRTGAAASKRHRGAVPLTISG